ncbi:MAG: hypothetical protein ACQ9MH_17775 [Nitrospinales bacterium]
MIENINNKLSCALRIGLNSYDLSSLTDMISFDLSQTNDLFEFAQATWKIDTNIKPVENDNCAYDLEVLFSVVEGKSQPVAGFAAFSFDKWSDENYILMPAAAYNGNRFKSKLLEYPPLAVDDEDRGLDPEILITDIPRLNQSGPSKLQQLAKDLSTPCMGLSIPSLSSGMLLLTEQKNSNGEYGYSVIENPKHSKGSMVISIPGVREELRYAGCKGITVPSEDRGLCVGQSESIKLKCRIYIFDCSRTLDLFDKFVNVRKEVTGKVDLINQIPFSAAFEIQQKKYNKENWLEEEGYYRVGVLERLNDYWQLGWIGGGISTYPFLAKGDSTSKQRALKTLDFMFSTQADTGFLPGTYAYGKPIGDGFGNPGTEYMVLIRKLADCLYFSIKQLMFLENSEYSGHVSQWKPKVKKLADAFVNLYRKQGQLGQFIDYKTCEIIIGGSTSAAIAPAGLALAGQYFEDSNYIRVARELAELFYERDLSNGITTGGPGEICQCADSESAFGLLESFVILYEVTGDSDWIKKAEDAAKLCFTWCVSYDFEFPAYSTFGKLEMRSAGTVWANVQNKHSAPGICTLSGDSLFKLYRATSNPMYLELIQEISHNLTQYLSRADRHISNLKPGWINERVELSDWDVPTGEVHCESSWCEVSNMLTHVELPGIYVQLDTGLICVFDHLEAEMVDCEGIGKKLSIYNPTNFDAKVSVFAENSCDMNVPIGQNDMCGLNCFDVPSQQRVEISFPVGGTVNEANIAKGSSVNREAYGQA